MSRRPSKRTIAITGVVAFLMVISGITLILDINAGGTTVTWEYSRNNEFGAPNNGYSALIVGSDGTIYSQESLSTWNLSDTGYNLLAINRDGSLKWEVDSIGTYGQYHERNGTLYCTSNGGLQLIDRTGNVLWNYHFMNGTIYLCDEFQEGAALLRHDNLWAVYLSNYTIHPYDELVSISVLGEKQWALDLTTLNASYCPNPIIGYNNTMLLFYEKDNRSFESGYGSDGIELWTMDITPIDIVGVTNSQSRGPIYYYESKWGINATTSILSVQAFDSRSGSLSWKRDFNSGALLSPGNGWIDHVFQDGKGVLYAFDIDNHSICALNEDGIVLWEKSFPSYSSILGECEDGGLLLLHYREDLTYEVLRVGASGDSLWKVNIATADGWTQPIIVGNGADFYYGEGRNLVAYQQSALNIFSIAFAVTLILAIMVAVFWLRPQIKKSK